VVLEGQSPADQAVSGSAAAGNREGRRRGSRDGAHWRRREAGAAGIRPAAAATVVGPAFTRRWHSGEPPATGRGVSASARCGRVCGGVGLLRESAKRWQCRRWARQLRRRRCTPRGGGARRGAGRRRQPGRGAHGARAPPFIGVGAAALGVSDTHAEGLRRLGQAGLGCRARMGSGEPGGWAELERVGPSGSAR
jgi:hypothetical protein